MIVEELENSEGESGSYLGMSSLAVCSRKFGCIPENVILKQVGRARS